MDQYTVPTYDRATDLGWMEYALGLADRALEQGEVPVGCVIVRDGAIVGEGWNRPSH